MHLLYITRWFKAYYCLLCRVNNKNCFVCQTTPAAYEISSTSRVFYCPLLTVFTLNFDSCTTDEDPVHEVLRGCFDEFQGLFSPNSDSISCFSCIENEFISRVPAVKNAPFYKKSLKILKKVSLKPTITVNTEWDGKIFVTF